MNDRINGVPDQASPNAFQDTQGFEGGQTQQQGGGSDPMIELRQMRAEMAQLREQNTRLERQMQSQGDKLAAKLQKQLRKNAEALQTAAELEGWDTETLESKLQQANQKSLSALGMDELKQLNEPEPQHAPQFEPAPMDAVMAYNQQVNGYLASLGLSATDFAPNEIQQLVAQGPSNDGIKTLTRRAAKVLDEKEALAKQAAQHMQRQQFANQVAEEIDSSGGLGGFSGSASVGMTAAQQNAERIIEQEKQKFIGTGTMVEWWQREAQLRQQYGLPPR